MSDENERDEPDEKHEATVLPSREVMSLISPGSTSVPGLGGLLGSDPTAGAGAPDPTAGAGGTPAAGAGDLASGTAQHVADGQQADQPSVSDQPQSISSSSTESASSET
jgi:hypothetical protein